MLTSDPIGKTMFWFAVPMILGNLLQQLYNIADTFIVGQFLGTEALAAVGTAYALMVFLNSVQLGLCMGSGAIFSMRYGEKEYGQLRGGIFVAFVLIGGMTLLLNVLAFGLLDLVMGLLCVPPEVYGLMREYLWVIFWGIGFTFLYNYFASLLRAVGNSLVPLAFLAVSVVLNIGLDLFFVVVCCWGVAGVAWATVIAQAVSGIGLGIYAFCRFPDLRCRREECRFRWKTVREITSYSFLTGLQQSVMNFGILLVQGLVNSFGTAVMAAFTAAIKIDSFAYMPAQDFGNAFSTFIAQNYGAGNHGRIRTGIPTAVRMTLGFCLLVSVAVFVFARPLMMVFVPPGEEEIISIGVEYLRIEGACYCGIGVLFLLYGYYRAVCRPVMSVVLTFISLGTRVVLAYVLAAVPAIGVSGIWWAIPIGWLLADVVGLCYYKRLKN